MSKLQEVLDELSQDMAPYRKTTYCKLYTRVKKGCGKGKVKIIRRRIVEVL